MKALVLEGIGEDVKILERQIPDLEPNEVLVEIKAAALNRRDWWIKNGKYAGLKFPIVLGSDGAGSVCKVGSTAMNNWINKDVIINPSFNWGDNPHFQSSSFKILGLPDDGTFADYVKIPLSQIYLKPKYLNFEEAAAFPLAALTAYRALFKKANLKSNESILITGIGAGTALFCLLFAKAIHAHIYVTSGVDDKILKAKKLGAIDGINYKDERWDDYFKSKIKGFDVVIDSALGNQFSKILNVSNPGARIVFFGATNGNISDINGRSIFWKQLNIYGTTMGSDNDFIEMLQFIEKHKIKPIIDECFTFQDVNKAFSKMTDSSQFGKLVLLNDKHFN